MRPLYYANFQTSSPHSLRDERPGILFKWIQAARRFIDQGENLRQIPASVRDATAAMFHEADHHSRFLDHLQFAKDFPAAQEPLDVKLPTNCWPRERRFSGKSVCLTSSMCAD